MRLRGTRRRGVSNHRIADLQNAELGPCGETVAKGDHPGKVRVNEQELRKRLALLRSEHRDLDDVIEQLSAEGPFNQLQIQRLKKRKLMLRDLISEGVMMPRSFDVDKFFLDLATVKQ